MKSQQNNDIYAIVLAAGKGTRMKSGRAKVLHEVLFAPMVSHVLDSLAELGASPVVVTGHQAEKVEDALTAYDASFVRQHEQLGTGHAVLATEDALVGKTGMVLILCGDTPLVRPQTLRQMTESHVKNQNCLTVMTTVLDNPTNYGRIVCGDAGEVQRIVEEKDASEKERQIAEVNAGMYCVEIAALFAALHQVGADNAQGELYLTDIIEIIKNDGARVGKFVCQDKDEILGVNSRVELEAANDIMRQRVNREFMLAGVSLVGSASIYIEKTVSIGLDTTIMGNCYLTGKTVIGSGCRIGPFCNLHNCDIKEGSTVPSFSCQ
jgi:bifunctional UDP-N-acetylglucosamine pyrophosphorylase/glucosamine-1-phosphate N-acetyltransferase